MFQLHFVFKMPYMQCPGESRALHFLRAAGAARARCILARLLEPALRAAPNQAMGARQSSFLRAARSAPVGDALSFIEEAHPGEESEIRP